MPKFIANAGFDLTNTYWYACLHLDSEKNYNIHYFILEKVPTKIRKAERLVNKNAIKRLKSDSISYLINRDGILKLKDKLFMSIVEDVRLNNLAKFSAKKKNNLELKITELYKKLPKEHRLQYNSPNLNKVRPLLDSIITQILNNKDVINDYHDYLEKLYEIDRQNFEYYGESSDNNYVDNQVHKLYSRVGNEILSNYKSLEDEEYLKNHQDYLSKNIFKLNLKSNNNITTEEKIILGESLLRITELSGLSTTQTKRLVKKWYSNSRFKNNEFEHYYTSLVNYFDDEARLTPKELYSTFNDMGISKDKYSKLKNKYYIQSNIKSKLYYNALQHIQYETERIRQEIIYEMSNL